MIADDNERELTEEEQMELDAIAAEKARIRQQIVKKLDRYMPKLRSLDEYQEKVLDDQEFLVVTVALSGLCQYCNSLQRDLAEMAKPIPQTKHAKFYRFDVHEAPDLAEFLHIGATPATSFTLKGETWDPGHIGASGRKIAAHFRNHLIRRNEKMREYDEEKARALLPPPVEVEENEEDEDEEYDEDY